MPTNGWEFSQSLQVERVAQSKQSGAPVRMVTLARRNGMSKGLGAGLGDDERAVEKKLIREDLSKEGHLEPNGPGLPSLCSAVKAGSGKS